MIDTAKRIRIFFEKAKENIDLQGFSNFPVGSCEGAALFLGNMLHELFPEKTIEYIKGYKDCGEMHFWLKVDGLVYDITADQFPEIPSPLYGADSQPLESIFNDTEVTPIELAFSMSDITNSTYKNSLMIELRYYLTGNV